MVTLLKCLRQTSSAFCLQVAVLLPFLTAGIALANSNDHAFAHVFVNVNPNVLVEAMPQPVADIPSLSSAENFQLSANFHVAANTDTLNFSCAASDLYLASVPFGENSIKVKTSGGCAIHAEHANPLSGSSNKVAFINDIKVVVDNFDAYISNMTAFQSYQDGRFNMNVRLSVEYRFDRPNMPQGQYGGVIKLVSLATE